MLRLKPLKQLIAMGAAVAILVESASCSAPRVHRPGPPAKPLPPAGQHGAARAHFTDVADQAGLRYRWSIAGARPLNILQTIGNGCAVLDYNNDGNLDILLVGPEVALYRGDGKGHFVDVTSETGLSHLKGHFLGCAIGDYDGDGYDDIYLSGYHTGVLLHNLRGSRFEDVTARAGLKPQPWGTSCAFAETTPGTGRLDLFVANYVHFGPDTVPQLCPNHNFKTACGPRFYQPLKGVFYRNQGNGQFRDSTAAAGFSTQRGRGLGTAFGDFMGDGLPGLAIANDETPGDLFEAHRVGGAVQYQNVGDTSGTAYDRDGEIHGGMGVDWGDYDNDGKIDLFVGTFQNEVKCLYHNDGAGLFSDNGIASGLSKASRPFITFGSKFFDFDNDGWLDLVLANGHIQDNVRLFDSTTTYRQPTLLYHNDGVRAGQFTEISGTAGAAFQNPIVGRGLAVGDFDNDGKLDLLIVDAEGKPLLLHNESTGTGHWLGIKLIGTASNRDGYGARLTAHIGKQTRVQWCHSDGSYMSASDSRVHFGLAVATQVDSLTVRWPSGHVDTYHNVAADRYITIREGDSVLRVAERTKPSR